METGFIKLLNMSISAGWLIIVICLLRQLLRKAPRWIRGLLWALVGIRLICPFTAESSFSLIPSAETIPPGIVYEAKPEIDSGIDALNQVVNAGLAQSMAPTPEASVNPLQIVLFFAARIWLMGMAVGLLYGMICCLRLRRKVAAAMHLEGNVWLSDDIGSPFILGIFKPRIYLPSNMEDPALVLAHERAHLRRKDPVWKLLAYLILALHWFNPLVQLAFRLFCRDLEMACDERVVKNMNGEEKKQYSRILLACSADAPKLGSCPLAFGEVGVKERVKTVLHYKKPAFWVIAAAIILCIAAAGCFLTHPKTEEPEDLKGNTAEEPESSRAKIGGADGPASIWMQSAETIEYRQDHVSICLDIPEGWEYTFLDQDASEEGGACGICFWPAGKQNEGTMELVYMPQFGVCGTGLTEEEVEFANGLKGRKGTYDNDPVWSFIVFYDTPDSYVAIRNGEAAWWPEYGEEAMAILSTARLGEKVTTAD